MTKTISRGVVMLCWLTATALAAPSETLQFGRFGTVSLYVPARPAEATLLLSGDAGWGDPEDVLARHLSAAGTLVIGVDSRHYVEQLEQGTEKCAAPAADLENLSHFVQSRAQLPEYLEPILVGYLAGGALSYGALAEAPAGLFRGAVSIGFCPDVDLKKALCTADDTPTPLRKGPDGATQGTTVLPSKTLSGKWIALQADDGLAAPGRACAAATRKFVGKTGGASVVNLGAALHDYTPTNDWMPKLDAAFRQVVGSHHDAARRDERPGTLPPQLADLPLRVIPAAHAGASPWFGIFLSGDGGWVALDKGIAKELATHDIPVVGWDSLKYFWSKRTPEGSSQDLDRVVRYYAAAWGKSRVLLIGYSQGADTLPFMVNRLPAATHAMIGFTTLLGISDNAIFEFHVTNWVSNPGGGIPTAPELAQWSGAPYLCVYGESDTDAACAELTGKGGEAIKLAGGHHFGGSYDRIANLILSRLPGVQPAQSNQ